MQNSCKCGDLLSDPAKLTSYPITTLGPRVIAVLKKSLLSATDSQFLMTYPRDKCCNNQKKCALPLVDLLGWFESKEARLYNRKVN